MTKKSKVPRIIIGEKAPHRVHKFAEHLMKKYKFLWVGGRAPLRVYHPKRGVWIHGGDELIKRKLYKLLGNEYKTTTVHEVSSVIRAASLPKMKDVLNTTIFDTAPHRMTMLNGVYDSDEFKFYPNFFPEEYHITSIPVTYDRKAKCPNIEKFLSEIISKKDAKMIIQFLGSCLYKSYIFKTIPILLGKGDNGKSILLEVIKNFLGSSNCNADTLQALAGGDRFATARLHGKLANIFADIPSKAMKYTGQIKALTGGDPITAQHKFGAGFTFVNYGKLIFSGNELPVVYDPTDAFFERTHLIMFNNTFPPGSKHRIDRDVLIMKLTTPEEMSGLLNLAIKGFKKLRKKGKYVGELRVDKKRIAYAKNSDPIAYLISIFFRRQFDSTIPKRTIDDLYRDTCRHLGKQPVSKTKLSQEILRRCPWIGEGWAPHPTKKGKRIRAWTGVQFTGDISDDDMEGLHTSE